MLRVTIIAIGMGTVLATGSPAQAGFREQLGWQFRSPAETQTKLNREALRNELDGRDLDGGSTAVSLGVPEVSGATVGNQTSGTTSYTVNLSGDNNDVTVDGYLNLSTSQQSEGQSSQVEKGSGQ